MYISNNSFKKFLILVISITSFFLFISNAVAITSQMSNNDESKVIKVGIIIEKLIKNKGESYRVKYIGALNKLKIKYKADVRKVALIQGVIEYLITNDKTNSSISMTSTNISSTASGLNDSPFALYGLFLPYTQEMCVGNIMSKNDTITELTNLNVKWVEEYEGKENNLTLIPTDVNIFTRIGNEAGFKSPNAATEEYKTALHEKVKKYKDKVKIWKVDDEPSERTPTTGTWGDPKDYDKYSKEYADFLQVSYTIIKEECPSCLVSVGGFAGVNTTDVTNQTQEFLKAMLAYSKEKYGKAAYFDVFEFKQNFYNSNDYKELKKKKDTYKKILGDYGVNLDEMPIFIETATHDGYPQKKPYALWLKDQSESIQASGLIKIYTYGISIGIDRIFWDNLLEDCYKNDSDEPFNYFGLINNPLNTDGLSHRKLAYYSFKKMIEILDGSDWNNIQTIQESDGIYIYKFTKNGKPLWVAWNDNTDSKTVSLDVGSLKSVNIVEAIPKYESGKDVSDYNNAFNTESKTAQSNKVNITIKDIPLFIGESIGSSSGISTTTSSSTTKSDIPSTATTSSTTTTSTSTTPGRCGDGICGPAETANPNLCPMDCKTK